MGEEREEDHKRHDSTISKHGLSSASINLLEQLKTDEYVDNLCQNPSFCCPTTLEIWDIDRQNTILLPLTLWTCVHNIW